MGGMVAEQVCAGLYWAQPWGGGIEVSLNIYGDDVDQQTNMKIDEAMQLTRDLVGLLTSLALEGLAFEDGETFEDIAKSANGALAAIKARRA